MHRFPCSGVSRTPMLSCWGAALPALCPFGQPCPSVKRPGSQLNSGHQTSVQVCKPRPTLSLHTQELPVPSCATQSSWCVRAWKSRQVVSALNKDGKRIKQPALSHSSQHKGLLPAHRQCRRSPPDGSRSPRLLSVLVPTAAGQIKAVL